MTCRGSNVGQRGKARQVGIGTMLLVVTGPIASGKSTLARAVACELERRGAKAAAVDLDLVYEMLDPPRGAKTDRQREQARRMTGRLAAALLADGVAVVVEGEFLTRDQRVEFTRVLPPAVVPALLVTLRVPSEVALRRAHDDPARGRVGVTPLFPLREHYEASTQAVRDAPSTDLALDTNAVGVTEAARVIADWASRELALPTMGSAGLNDDKRAWELDELAHAGHEHLDALYVAGYDESHLPTGARTSRTFARSESGARAP